MDKVQVELGAEDAKVLFRLITELAASDPFNPDFKPAADRIAIATARALLNKGI